MNPTNLPPWKIWLLAIRPATLSAAVIPVLVGSGYLIHGRKWRPWLTILTLIVSCLIQIGTNFVNDLFDFRKGADTKERLGPLRAVQAGLLSEKQILHGLLLVFWLAILLGISLVMAGGPWVILIGALSIASGILYTAGPYPLAYNGLGDFFVFLFFGMAGVCGTIFVQQRFVPAIAFFISLPVGFLSTAILVVNNVRDESTDRMFNKKTLVVRFGRMFGIWEYRCFLLLSYMCPVLLFLGGRWGLLSLLPLVTFPMGVSLFAQVSSKQGKDLNPVLVQTAKLLLLFGFLWSIGIAWG